MKYEDITQEDLGTKRQRPMYLSEFHRFRSRLSMLEYPHDPCEYCNHTFLPTIDEWIQRHKRAKYIGLDTFPVRHTILGVTQQLDELHQLHNNNIAVFEGEYKYHQRLPNHVRIVKDKLDIMPMECVIISAPSTITTNNLPNLPEILDYCSSIDAQVHIDGAWFSQCRGFELDGPIRIMNDYGYQNVSDAWIGVKSIEYFGTDFWWDNYENLYEKVCEDFNLEESDSIHVAWRGMDYVGVRTPLRMLIENKYDIRGTDRGLNAVELLEK